MRRGGLSLAGVQTLKLMALSLFISPVISVNVNREERTWKGRGEGDDGYKVMSA